MRSLVGATKEEIIKQANIKWVDPKTNDNNGRIDIYPPNEEYMYSVAYNDEGKYQNHMELSKYLGLFQLNTNKPNYTLQYLTLPVEYYNVGNGSFEDIDSLVKNMKDHREEYIPKDVVSILRYKQGTSTKNIQDAIKDSGVYYSLKKLILEYESKSLIGTIEPYDILIDSNGAQFQWLDNIFLLKESNYLICPQCDDGILRFDLDDFLDGVEDKEWISKYRCANSLCGFETDFESLRRNKYFNEWCYTEQDYRKNYYESSDSFRSWGYSADDDNDYDYD